jgi:hypothetical protein
MDGDECSLRCGAWLGHFSCVHRNTSRGNLVHLLRPINAFSEKILWLAFLPNILLIVLFNRWMNVDNKLFWLVVTEAFPIIAWGALGLWFQGKLSHPHFKRRRSSPHATK